MIEPKWTPGPWSVADHGNYIEFEDGIIAETHHGGFTDEDGCSHKPYIPNEANAHLIAAAPDLYAALLSAVNLLVSFSDDPEDDLSEYLEVLHRARGEETPEK